jgi:hypothetical protein
MIPSDLIFQVEPIRDISSWWSGDIILIWGIALPLTLIFLFFYRQKSWEEWRIKEKKIEKNIDIPHIEDRDFETHVAQIIRMMIGYPVYPADAHTAREIGKYSRNQALLDLLADIEMREYRWEILSESERRSVREVLLQKAKN